MFPFLAESEFALVQRDMDQMITGDGSTVTVHYKTPVTDGAAPDPDPVFGTDKRPLKPVDTTLADVPCMIKIVHERDLKILGFGIVEVGDAIIYLLDDFNLQEPVKGKPAVPETLYFVDSFSVEWYPILKEAGPLKRHLSMAFNNQPISEVVLCSLRK